MRDFEKKIRYLGTLPTLLGFIKYYFHTHFIRKQYKKLLETVPLSTHFILFGEKWFLFLKYLSVWGAYLFNCWNNLKKKCINLLKAGIWKKVVSISFSAHGFSNTDTNVCSFFEIQIQIQISRYSFDRTNGFNEFFFAIPVTVLGRSLFNVNSIYLCRVYFLLLMFLHFCERYLH